METIKIWVPVNELSLITETNPPTKYYFSEVVGPFAEITITPLTLKNWQSKQTLKELPKNESKKQMLFG